MAGVKRRLDTDSDIRALNKELDAVSCPICMDHPHNAVLLLCSSHDKGCRSYICDTSYRHSNCLDRFKKMRENTRNSPTLPSPFPINLVDSESFQERDEHDDLDGENSPESQLSLKCPMCRGAILGWEVVEDARKYLNLKKRSCSRESCSFSGNYQELRRHARRVHPTTRPSDIDPSRERAWRHLEHQREFGDVVSAIHSAMPGAVVVGDYVIENGDRLPGGGESGAEREEISSSSNKNATTNDQEAKPNYIILFRRGSVGVYQKSSKGVEESKSGSKKFKPFTFLCRKVVATPCFNSTLQLKRLNSINRRQARQHWIQSMKIMKKEDIAKGLGISSTKADSVNVSNKVLPVNDSTLSTLTSTNEQCGLPEKKEQLKGDKTKTLSRMKELLRWAAAAKSDKGGKFIARKVQF
ncbi:hypothetical protein D8674_027065 [Pyrus ussuriensis x Pyrus communis]|uniref:Uncharacterized protein n=1 Tax=Pyrus ussuriensis x Pyrus communis TaxID=2448454 RepID=A0A5N5ID81_9ROSA|nr:hypothetical protein D8674_027065 [Pyrus ussuriensis x Pyrus communis]